MINPGPKFHPRSPVQPGRNPAPVLLIAVVAALAVWTIWQNWPEANSPADNTAQKSRSASDITDKLEQRGDARGLEGLFNNDDYPADALDRNEQGTTRVRVDVDRRGLVSSCSVIVSSGSQSLDTATCRIIKSRARFQPATDASGNAVQASVDQTITWRIAD